MTDRDRLWFIGITKDARTAGPGKRLELFLKGCIRGIVNPCQGCFNPTTWEFGGPRREMTVDEVVDFIVRDAWNRQVTFCGGEPLLQTRNLIKVCRRLKELDPKFHIVIYTAYVLENLLRNGIVFVPRACDGPEVHEALQVYSSSWTEDRSRYQIATPDEILELLKYVDMLVDGDYQHDKRLPVSPTMDEGMFIGSANQRVIYAAESLRRDPSGQHFEMLYADEYNRRMACQKTCRCCGHALLDDSMHFCDEDCEQRFVERDEYMKIFGGA
ncbi:4Fe-4S single cluster domain-containing protein [Alicyclobacillus shizuokensis]|uniref:4Fe-4S single cluster domain-containing protein n=1 Tax=Alicyclobacillus shizuokensis TaxID=392014 RepID=UPI001470297A|nr:4Fe-4S single cluster domain-containing protein [Alicyclobacillus shizuokensis]